MLDSILFLRLLIVKITQIRIHLHLTYFVNAPKMTAIESQLSTASDWSLYFYSAQLVVLFDYDPRSDRSR